MSPKERLDAAQVALERRGVRDVKFTFAPDVSSKTSDEVAGAVADALEAYLAGNFEEVDMSSVDAEALPPPPAEKE